MLVKDENGQLWLLVDKKTGQPLMKGADLTTFRGEPCVLADATPPRHAGSTGRVYVKAEGHRYPSEYFPGVVGAQWVRQNTQQAQGDQ